MSFQPTIQPRGFDFLKDVDVRLSVELGRASLTLREVLCLGEESVVMLDRLTDELLDVMVNGKIIAKGEIMAQDNRFGLRIVELAGGDAVPSPAQSPPFAAPAMSEPFEPERAAMPKSRKPARGNPASEVGAFDEAELDRIAQGKA